MLFLIGTMETLLAPGDFFNFTCSSGEDSATIEIKHENEDYYFSLAIESLDGTVVTGTATDPNNQVKTLHMNSRQTLKGFAVGTTTVVLQCSIIGTDNRMVYVSYTDSLLLEQNEQYSTTQNAIKSQSKDFYVIVPVCHHGTINVKTNGLVYASYDTARPSAENNKFNNADTKADFQITDIMLPGILNIHVVFDSSVSEGLLLVNQGEPKVVTLGAEMFGKVSAMAHCYNHYTVEVDTHDHLVIAIADNDNQMKTATPVGYLKSEVNQYAPASYYDYKYISSHGVIDVDPSQYPSEYTEKHTLDLAISVGYNTAFLPVTHNISEQYSNYTYGLYATVNGTALQPAHEVVVTVPENYDHIDSVVLFKDTDQVRYTDSNLNVNSQLFSSYVVQLETDDPDELQRINFGYDQPGQTQGVSN